VKQSRPALLFLLAALTLNAAAQPELKHSQDWFRQAGERMNLHQPGFQPFHLHVRFHAFAGEELLAPGQQSQFITGEGSYDEIWLNPQTWRREVTLADYHAIEIQANGVRKMQASTDYEPSRVLMLLQNLLTPVPNHLVEKGSNTAQNWQIDHVAAGNNSVVRLSKVKISNSRLTLKDYWTFLPSGELLSSNSNGLIAVWTGVNTFGSKTVPIRLTLKTDDLDLLNAVITIEPAGQADTSTWVLPGSPAEPGMTLHIENTSEVHRPDPILKSIYPETGAETSGQKQASALAMTGVLDRTGVYREVEALIATDPSRASKILAQVRAAHSKPATLDKSPCEYNPTSLVVSEH
jgi:hypothetical protein